MTIAGKYTSWDLVFVPTPQVIDETFPTDLTGWAQHSVTIFLRVPDGLKLHLRWRATKNISLLPSLLPLNTYLLFRSRLRCPLFKETFPDPPDRAHFLCLTPSYIQGEFIPLIFICVAIAITPVSFTR